MGKNRTLRYLGHACGSLGAQLHDRALAVLLIKIRQGVLQRLELFGLRAGCGRLLV